MESTVDESNAELSLQISMRVLFIIHAVKTDVHITCLNWRKWCRKLLKVRKFYVVSRTYLESANVRTVRSNLRLRSTHYTLHYSNETSGPFYTSTDTMMSGEFSFKIGLNESVVEKAI